MKEPHLKAYGGPVPRRVRIVPIDRTVRDEAVRTQDRILRNFFLLLFVPPAVLFAGFLVLTIPARPCLPVGKLELKSAHDLSWLLRMAADNSDASKAPEGPYASDAKGLAFWQDLCVRAEKHHSPADKLVSLAGRDERANAELLRSREIELQPENCSFTAPRASQFASLLKGDRCVLVTFNARNWSNYPEKGVIVIWSDHEEAQWLEFKDAADDWGITAEEWADPAGKLFGKKAPFHQTFE